MAETVQTRAAVCCQSRGPDQLREFACRPTAQQIHLEEALLSVHIAECKGDIEPIASAQSDGAERVALDAHGCVDAGNRQRALQLRQTRAQHQPAADQRQHQQRRYEDQGATQPAHQGWAGAAVIDNSWARKLSMSVHSSISMLVGLPAPWPARVSMRAR